MHLRSKTGTVLSCGPFARTKFPNFEMVAYLDKFAYSCGGELHREPAFCFLTCFAVVARLNVGPKGQHMRET